MSDCCETKTACREVHTQNPTIKIALAGNPNCGKTTLFNALTGAKQKVGNWPGVTVEKKSGHFSFGNSVVEVTDLPGVYALSMADGAIDERIACDFILQNPKHIIINIIDANNLERHLYLTTQLIEMGAQLIVALNMMDIAHQQGLQIDCKRLSLQLGVPVIAISANKGDGIKDLQRAIHRYQPPSERIALNYPAELQQAILTIDDYLQINPKRICHPEIDRLWLAMRLLEEDGYATRFVDKTIVAFVRKTQSHIQNTLGEDADILLADTRYRFIDDVLKVCLKTQSSPIKTWTTRIDNIVLNRVLGLPIFLLIMYSLFVFSINIGGAFQDFFDITTQTIFVDGFAHVLAQMHTPTWLTVLLANGIGKGINTTVTFIPVIGAMFLFLAFLEDSGYMARAAFVIDRFMRALGLPGKAFVPMIVGFGCNVPAIMGARTLENKRDRILTIMMSPFMSCGARLAIFAVFTTAFFPHGGQNIVFLLYLIGIAIAVLTGFVLRKTLLQGELSPLIMELPLYHMPHFKTLCLHAWQRLKSFVFRAGKLIVPICVLIGALNTLNIDGSIGDAEGNVHSLLSLVGQWATPIFSPMGLTLDNWPATVGLVTGILAKEVVVGTLNTLYTQVGHFAAGGAENFAFFASLKEALLSIPQNLAELTNAFSNPILAKAPIHPMEQGVYGLMYQKFDGQIGAFAYLLFVLLYVPCISTTAVILRELSRGWAIFSIVWMTGVAYGAAVLFYQTATLMRHPLSSSLWLVGISFVFMFTLFFMRRAAAKDDRHRETSLIAHGRMV